MIPGSPDGIENLFVTKGWLHSVYVTKEGEIWYKKNEKHKEWLEEQEEKRKQRERDLQKAKKAKGPKEKAKSGKYFGANSKGEKSGR